MAHMNNEGADGSNSGMDEDIANQERDTTLVNIDPSAITSKFTSKQDLYYALNVTRKLPLFYLILNIVGFYLPPYAHCSVDFIKDVMGERKRFLMRDQLLPVHVPGFDELSVKKLYPVFINDDEAREYLPALREGEKLPYREWFFNVLNTIKTGAIQELI